MPAQGCPYTFSSGTLSKSEHTATLTALRDCASDGDVTVLAVHVVGATTRVVSQPNSNIFDLQG